LPDHSHVAAGLTEDRFDGFRILDVHRALNAQDRTRRSDAAVRVVGADRRRELAVAARRQH
jgi:hypothetical protein